MQTHRWGNTSGFTGSENATGGRIGSRRITPPKKVARPPDDRNRLDRYMEDSNGPLIVHSGNRVSRYQINTKYDPPAIRVVDREEVWNKWVDETDKASRVIEPDGGTGPVVPKKFD